MAKYEINGKEVTEEEFNKQVFKAVEESPFFLDDILSVSFLPKSNAEIEQILNEIRKIAGKNNKTEEKLEDILKRNMNIGASEYSNPKLEKKFSDLVDKINLGEVGWVKNNTGGTVFEKVQDTTTNEGQIKLLVELAEKINNQQNYSNGGFYNYLDSFKPTTITTDWQEKQQSKSQALRQQDYPQPEDNKNKLRDILGKKHIEKSAKKETEGKLFYELDFEFIEQMAERMQSNKDNDKYEKWNWKKPMTPKGIEDLKQAMWRHIIEVMQGNYTDDGRIYGHLEAISNNAMMINYQLKNK